MKPLARPSVTIQPLALGSILVKPWAMLFFLLLMGSAAIAQEAAAPVAPAHQWDRATIAIAQRLPVQEGGRIKPLATRARFMLLDLSGRTSYREPDGRKLSALEWFLDSWLYPERAQNYEVFLVQTSEVLDALGLQHAGKRKRDRYSYAELRPARERMFELADAYSRIDAKQRNHVQAQIVNLAHGLHGLEQVLHDLDFARGVLPLGNSPRLAAVFEPADLVRVPGASSPGADAGVSVLRVLEKSRDLVRVHESEPLPEPAGATERQTLTLLLNGAWTAASGAQALALLPPRATREEAPQWLTPAEIFAMVVNGSADPEQVALVRDLEEMAAQRDDPARFNAALERFHQGVTVSARARGEDSKLGLENALYHGKLLQRSLMLYLVGFVFTALGWLLSKALWPGRVAIVALALGTGTLVAAIVLRCIIRSRPPVSTLYETILFITAMAVTVSLVIELMNRQRIALALAAVLGASGLFLAGRYEALEGIDTMPSLVAVLDTNFWLSTHVTTITMGYAAGLLASAFAHLYVIGRLVRGSRPPGQRFKSLARMTYGVVCFGLIFSVVGTILGGVWANESWGRFWGWDPKENGALMIVLWELAILHARMGGYIRDLGISLAAIFGGMIVAFSWWGVNLLGIGLHSYGFTSGVMRALMIFYVVEVGVLAAGAVVVWRDRRRTARPPSMPRATGAPEPPPAPA